MLVAFQLARFLVLSQLLLSRIYIFIIFSSFVIEALSVILQVGSYKLRKKNFLMAPIHHHFEKLGFSEVRVVKAFWLTSFILHALEH